jgi:methyl-accepting chemotaxis protein
MREIATASEQQQQGVEQLHIAVGQLNQVTQQTAANADEAASTAEELSGQAAEMQHMIRTFHLSHIPVDAASAPAPLAHPHSTPPAQERLHQPLSPANGHAMPTVPRDFIPFDDDEDDLQGF